MIQCTEPKLLPLALMARRLRVSVRWLRAEAESGRVPALRADRTFLFNPEAVERALVQRAEQVAPAEAPA
jgi:hypothetical protein